MRLVFASIISVLAQEDSVMLQVSKPPRSHQHKLLEQLAKSGEIDDAGVKQSDQTSAGILYQSAVHLLREGATNDVVSFSEESLKQIAGPLRKSILTAHESDDARLKELYPQFQKVLDTYALKKADVLNGRTDEAQQSAAHKECREQHSDLFNKHNDCRETEANLWAMHQKLANSFSCVQPKPVDKNNIKLFRESVELGQTIVTSWESANTKMKECDGIQEKLEAKKTECDEKQSQLEEKVCIIQMEHKLSKDEVIHEWELATDAWEKMTQAVLSEVEMRKKEFATLAEVECLLENIHKRGGTPCSDQKDEDGNDEADKVILACHGELDLSNWTIEPDEVPDAPVPLEDQPCPCSENYIIKHYKHLHSESFGLALCKPCLDSPECNPPTNIRFSTGQMHSKPSNIGFENAVNSAVIDRQICSKDLDSLASYSNRATCGGSNKDVAYKIEVTFMVHVPGIWEFDFNVDFGWGGVVTFDGIRSGEGYHDENHWWSRDLNKALPLDIKHELNKGLHQMVVYGAEGCCDGTSNIRFKKPCDSEWKYLTTENLEAYSASIRFSTGVQSSKPPHDSFENVVNSAVIEKPICSKYLDSLASYSNQATCGGSRQNVAFKIEVTFMVHVPGSWEFDFNVDFGWGGVVTFDGIRSTEGYHGGDHWWSRDLNKALPLDIKQELNKGWHTMVVYGAEGCCDGGSNIRFKKPGDSDWKMLTTENLEAQ